MLAGHIDIIQLLQPSPTLDNLYQNSDTSHYPHILKIVKPY